MTWRSHETLKAGVGVLGLSALFFAIGFISHEPPPRSSLTELTGQLRYVERVLSKRSLNAIRFGLTSDPRHFQYVSKAGAANEVLEALEGAEERRVRIAFDSSDSHTPWFEDRALYTIYELTVEGRPVRSYDQVASSWTGDNAFGRWVAYGLASGGLLLLFVHFRARRRI